MDIIIDEMSKVSLGSKLAQILSNHEFIHSFQRQRENSLDQLKNSKANSSTKLNVFF